GRESQRRLINASTASVTSQSPAGARIATVSEPSFLDQFFGLNPPQGRESQPASAVPSRGHGRLKPPQGRRSQHRCVAWTNSSPPCLNPPQGRESQPA